MSLPFLWSIKFCNSPSNSDGVSTINVYSSSKDRVGCSDTLYSMSISTFSAHSTMYSDGLYCTGYICTFTKTHLSFPFSPIPTSYSYQVSIETGGFSFICNFSFTEVCPAIIGSGAIITSFVSCCL